MTTPIDMITWEVGISQVTTPRQKTIDKETGEMAQQVRVLVALPE